MLFSGDSRFPHLSQIEDQATVLNSLALSYVLSGRPGQSKHLFEDSSLLFEYLGDWAGVSTTLGNLADALRLSGMLRKSELIARKALAIDHSNADEHREATSLRWLGLVLATRGLSDLAKISLSWGLAISGMGIDKTALAQWALWANREAEARLRSQEAWEGALQSRQERDLVRAALLEGLSSQRLGDLRNAEDRLHYALTHARAVNHARESFNRWSRWPSCSGDRAT